MPTYTYQCRSCGSVDEVKQRITEDAIKSCPHCKKKTYERLIAGGTGFVLKGGGWYSDGYSGGGKKESSASSDTGSTGAKAGGHGCGGNCACG